MVIRSITVDLIQHIQRTYWGGISVDNSWIFFSFLLKNICCGYSLIESTHSGTANEYPQDMFYGQHIL